MTKKMMILLMIFGLAAMGNPAGAQDYGYGFDREDYELTLQGSGTSDNAFDTTTLSLEAGLGYFYTPMVEAGVRQGIGYVGIDDGDDLWNGSSRVFLDFHFDLTSVVPFFGANLGYLYGDGVNNTWIAGPEAGFKAFVSKTAFIYLLTEYNFTFEDADEADDAFDDGRFVYALGVGIRW